MTAWAFAFGWNWLLVPVAAYFARRFWLATREPGLKYLQHTNLTIATPARIGQRDRRLIERWHDHLTYSSLYPVEPPQPGDVIRASSLLDVLRREGMFPWHKNREVWLVDEAGATRESDGLCANAELYRRLRGMIAVAEARKIETEELSK